MTEENPRDAAIYAAVAKFRDIIRTFNAADADLARAKAVVEEAEKRKSEASSQYLKLIEMAELFGFDLDEEYKSARERYNLSLTPQTTSPDPRLTAAALTPGGPKTVKERAIAEAKQAHPNSIRASTLKQKLESEGTKVHEKTVGMTLYRLLREGILRREGWDWFFVPEDQRKGQKGKEKPDAPNVR